MAHLSEGTLPLVVRYVALESHEKLTSLVRNFSDVCMLVLPPYLDPKQYQKPIKGIGNLVAGVAKRLAEGATLITLGEVIDLVQVQAAMPSALRYQHLIAIKRTPIKLSDTRSLPNHHFCALIHTKYRQSLRHIKTRIRYTYCPFCNKTTKDYGGKKHTYHEYGTLMSDVWRDLECNLEGDLTPIVERFRDLFGIDSYKELLVIDCRHLKLGRAGTRENQASDLNSSKVGAGASFLTQETNELPPHLVNQVLEGDCLEWLKNIPNNSIDFVFVDPPYNLGKSYTGYSDNLEIREYFSWCDQWIVELARVIKPGRSIALLNIPLWAIRHFLFMQSILRFQNWIVWDALAFPVRLIMPAHYTILVFSKGEPRDLPGLIGEAGSVGVESFRNNFKALEPLAEGFCLRSKCVKLRQAKGVCDRGPLTDLWWDIHRLKHNTRRVDHPTQLPPYLMYRLIAIFTKPGEIVLDCFNGAGTTTLAAHQLERRYIGIDKSKEYCELARARHEELSRGINPFRKANRDLSAKNSPVPRLPKRTYEIPKKTLQLEVKRVAQELGHLPNREELARYGKFPIRYYDEYFLSWGEVCAAARTTGMTEEMTPLGSKALLTSEKQLTLDFKPKE